MKTIILILTILCSLGVKAQFSRSFYHDWEFKNDQQSINLYENGFFYLAVANINEQSQTIELKLGKINSIGDLVESNLISLKFNSSSTNVRLIGFSMNDDGSYNVSIIHSSTNTNQILAFYKIQNNAIISQYEVTDLDKNNAIITKKNGGDLITYAYKNNVGLVRLSLPIQSYNSVDVEVLNYSTTNVYYNVNSFKTLDFEFLNGFEYILTSSNKIFKRNAPNVYQNNNLTFTSSSITSDYDLFISQNTLKIAKEFSIFDIDLSNLTISSTVVLSDSEINTTNASVLNLTKCNVIDANGIIYMAIKYLSRNWFLKIAGNQIVEKIKMDETIREIKYNSSIGFHCSGYVMSLHVNDFYQLEPIQEINAYTPLVLCFNELNEKKEFDEYFSSIRFNAFNANIGVGSELLSKGLKHTQSVKIIFNDTLRPVLYCSTPYLVGQNNSNQCFTTIEDGYFHNTGFYPGPFTINYTNRDLTFAKYNRPFYVTKQMINDHIAQINAGNQNYIIPFGIREWPAHGNVNEGQAQNLVEFMDVNNNGIYEPQLGEYPKIYGDQCVLTIQSKIDVLKNIHLEWYHFVYSFDCDNVYNQTIFLKTVYINRGQNLTELYLSNFNDLDLGNYSDDYVGTNVELGMIYGYNGDDFDEDNMGIPCFKNNTASFGIQFLKGSKLGSDFLDNEIGIGQNEKPNGLGFDDMIVDNEYSTLEASTSYNSYSVDPYQDPNNCNEMLYAAQGLYSDGSSLKINGINSKYCYPGESDSLFYATDGVDPQFISSEYSVNNLKGDRRMIGSTGSFSLAQNEKVEFDFAYICAIDTLGISSQNSVDILFDYAAQIKNDFAQNQAACGGQFYAQNKKIIKNDKDVTAYPNPFENKITIEGLMKNGGLISVINLDGKVLIEKEISSAVENVNLEELKSGIYFMKIDNGNQQSLKKIVKK